MYIAPNSVVYLLRGVPLNKKYVHTVAYKTPTEQFNGFMNYKVKTATALQYIRDTGSLKINFSADDIYGCNYMVFKNSPYTTKYYYAFIDRIAYIGNNVSELFFTIDPIQSYWFDFEFLPCYVEREHSKTDNVGDNLIAEPLKFEKSVYKNIPNTGLPFKPNDYRIVVGVTETPVITEEGETKWRANNNRIVSNVYSALGFNDSADASEVKLLLDQYTDAGKQNAIKVVYICPHPKLCDNIGPRYTDFVDQNVYQPTEPNKDNILDIFVNYPVSVDGYIPRNKKLLTSQFQEITISDLNGQTSNLAPEHFWNAYIGDYTMMFRIMMTHSATPEIICFPVNYYTQDPKTNMMYGVVNNAVSFGCASISNFDSWWAYNSTKFIVSNASRVANSAIRIGAGDFGNAISSEVNIVSDVALAMNEYEIEKREPNKLLTQSTGGAEMTGCAYGFILLYNSIHDYEARMVDNYFDLFGYQTNTTKVPGIYNRPTYNFVKTKGCMIKGTDGGLPSNATENICKVFDNGITLWKDLDSVGDYSLRNDPVE